MAYDDDDLPAIGAGPRPARALVWMFLALFVALTFIAMLLWLRPGGLS